MLVSQALEVIDIRSGYSKEFKKTYALLQLNKVYEDLVNKSEIYVENTKLTINTGDDFLDISSLNGKNFSVFISSNEVFQSDEPFDILPSGLYYKVRGTQMDFNFGPVAEDTIVDIKYTKLASVLSSTDTIPVEVDNFVVTGTLLLLSDPLAYTSWMVNAVEELAFSLGNLRFAQVDDETFF